MENNSEEDDVCLQVLPRGVHEPVVQLVVRQPYLSLQLGSYLRSLTHQPLLPAVSVRPLSSSLLPTPAQVPGEEGENSFSDYLQSLSNKCRALVPLKPPTLPPPSTVPVVISELEPEKEANSQSRVQTVPTSPHCLSQQLEREVQEMEELGAESDEELIMPAEEGVNTSSLVESDCQEPPQKMARLSSLDREEDEEYLISERADDGSSTSDQAVPGESAEGEPPSARPSPCRQQRGGGGREGGRPAGKQKVVVCGDQQVVPTGEGEEAGPPATSLYVSDHSKQSPPAPSVWQERVYSGEEDVWKEPSGCFRCSRRVAYCPPDSCCPTTVQLNLSRPKLRLGLSKCQKPQPLHTSLLVREE